MTIRTRLLILLLPTLTALLILDSLFVYFHWSREVLLIGSFMTFLLVIGTVFIIADRISKPVRQLNRAALAIAAGNYEANIQVEGPKEIMELAHTLNTMGQCLVEHISRLKESSLIRERMYGEYECSLLLQYYMLQKVIEDFSNPHLSVRLVSIPQSPLQKGLFLKMDRLSESELTLTLFESQEQGFAGLPAQRQIPR
jgi:HAMP domain-containing protein